MDELENKITVNDSASIQRKMYTIHEVQAMLDADLANFYGIESMVLNQTFERNMERFPEECIFKLTKDEYENLMSQFAISNDDYLGHKM